MSGSLQEEIIEAFHYYDNKGDKKISAAQIGNCLRSLGLAPTQAQIEKMTQQWAKNPEARVSIEEFTPIFVNLRKELGKERSMEPFIGLMSHFDREGNNNIMLADLRMMLQNAGEKLSPQEVDNLLFGMEITDGKVSAVDFVRMIMSN